MSDDKLAALRLIASGILKTAMGEVGKAFALMMTALRLGGSYNRAAQTNQQQGRQEPVAARTDAQI